MIIKNNAEVLIGDYSCPKILNEEVLKCLKQELKQGTNRMIAKKLWWDINRVTGRVTELVGLGMVSANGTYFDQAISGWHSYSVYDSKKMDDSLLGE